MQFIDLHTHSQASDGTDSPGQLVRNAQIQGLAAVASAASIDFLRPAFAGERLVATARVKQQGMLTGVYDIEIVNQQQKIVALFRGKSHRIGGTITGDV